MPASPRCPSAADRTVVIAGAGDLGRRVAALRAQRNDAVIALRRRETAVAGARLLRADLGTGVGLAGLPRAPASLVFCAAPDRRDEAAYRALYVDGLRRLLDHCEPARLVLVSSTAVYGEHGGAWVDEHTPPAPGAFNGRVLLAAEQVALDAGGHVLRLSGLYGPGRTMLLRRARDGGPGRRTWTNRIHVDDAATAVSHLLDLAAPERIHIGSDDGPAQEHEVLSWLRARHGWPDAPPLAGPECGRRLSNRRLRRSGWCARFPDYRAGYAAEGAAG